MKEKVIYKGEKLVASYSDLGWIIYSSEKRWIKYYLKRNKDNIHRSDALMSLVRSCCICEIIKFFRK